MSSCTTVQLVVNGASMEASVEPRTSLADVLRDKFQLTGTHVACEQGVCGACTVIVDGKPVRSCITWAVSLAGAEVRTIEGFEADPTMQRLRDAFSREHGLQCGFCTPGMLVTARDIALRLPGCDETRVRHELGGNLCRCTGYSGIVRAVCSVVSPDGARPGEKRPTRPLLETFDPVQDAGDASAPATAAVNEPAEPGAQITETIVVHGCDAQRLWELLSDVGAAATCLPGARVDRFDGKTIAGAVKVSFGPIKAEFVGEGAVMREESARRAMIRGTATDHRSRTRAKADIVYRTEPEPGDGDAARLVIGLEYDVQGPLAQFSRSDLVRSLVRQVVRDFGRNLEALAAGDSKRAASSGFSALGLLGRWLLARIRGLIR